MSTSSNGATTVSLAPGVGVTLTGALTLSRPSTGGSNTFQVNAGTLTCGSIANGGSTAGSRTTELEVSTGTVNVSGSITTAGASSLITFTDAGTINTNGTFMTSTTRGTFTPDAGTVNYKGSGSQAIALLTYSNLTLSNAGAKTFPAGTTTVTGILSIEGSASTVMTGSIAYGGAATLQYRTTDTHTCGSEWPANFTATGGIIIANPSGSVMLNGIKTINSSSQLTIGDGASSGVFDDGGFQVTCTGTLNFHSGTYRLGGSSATTFPSFSTMIIDPGTTVEYDATVSQTVSTTPVYSNLTLTNSSKKIGNSSGAVLNVNTSLTINSTATYLGTTYNPALNIGGDFHNSGTFTQGTGLVTFDGTTAQSITGTATFNRITIANTGADVTSNDDLSVAGANDFTISNGASFIFSGTTLDLGGDFVNNGTFTQASGTTVFSGGSAQQIGGNSQANFTNLTLDNSNGLSIAGSASPIISGTLTFTNGKISTGANSIILGNAATVTGTSAGKYIFGNLTKGISAATSSETFEIGDDSKYTPVILNFSGTATNGTGSITAKTTAGNHPNIGTSTIDPALSVNRYWTLINNGVTFGTCSATFTFINPDDLEPGTNPSDFVINRYSSSTWTSPAVGSLTTTTSQTTGLTSTGFGDFQVGELLAPRISVGSVSGFGFQHVNTISAEQNYSVTGRNLVAPVIITPPVGFEISSTSGSGFITNPSTLSLTPSGGMVNAVIYVRFHPTSVQAYNGNISHASTGAVSKNVALSGTSVVAYCDASSTSYTEYESITNFTFGGINNSSPVAKTAGYFDYTQSVAAANVIQGISYPISITEQFVSTVDKGYCKVFIDYNQNGVFDVPTEVAYEGAYSGNMTMSGNTLIPLTALTGLTRVRVVLKGVGTTGDTDPCGTFTWGEVEDYSVNIVSPYPNIYRSVATGNWNVISTWEYSSDNGQSWYPAITAPSATDGTINIRNPHVVTQTVTVTADQVTVEAGGTLALSQNMVISDGTGTDMDISGTLDCSNFILSGAGSVAIESGAQLIMKSPDGISSSGSTGNIQTTGRSFNSAANYKYNGSSAQVIGNGLPGTVNNITIDNSAGVSLTGAVTINGSLALTSGACSIGSNTLTFQNSNTPIVRTGGTITTNSSSNLIFGTAGNTGGNAFVIPSGTFTSAPVISNLAINRTNSLTLNNQVLSIQGVLTASGPLNTNGNLVLLSTAAQTALISGAGTGTITGNVTMQRYLPSGFGYKYFGSPFQSATVAEFADEIDLSASFPTFYRYDENLGSTGWVNYTSASGTLTPLVGYAGNLGVSAAAKTVSVSGVVNNGVMGPLTLYNHNRTYSAGFNLVGNPYPSPIDWNAASGWTKTNIDNALYYFNNGIADQYTGTYSTYINGVSSDGIANNIIPSMQGFFVHVSNGAFPVTAQFGMNNNVRVNNLSPVFHKGISSETRALLRLTAAFDKEGALNDPLVIYFDDESTMGFDSDHDALKLINTDFGVPNIYVPLSGGARLSIMAIPEPKDSITVIPLGLKTLTDGWIILKTSSVERIPSSEKIYLYDARTKIYRNLLVNPEFRFFMLAGDCEDRFSIVFSQSELKFGSGYDGEFLVYSSGSMIFAYANLAAGETGELSVFNMLGQQIWQQKITQSMVHEIDLNQGKGVYIVEFSSSRGKQSKKVLITDP